MRLAVLDVETTLLADGEIPRTLFWGLAIEGEDYRRFETTAQMWNFLVRYSEPLCVYSHHDYDMVQALSDGAPLVVKDIRSGRILRAMIGSRHEWRNSHAIFPTKLADILAVLGKPKPSLDDLEARNLADTVDALEAFKRLDESYHGAWGVRPLGASYLTAASCSFAAAERVAGPLPRWLNNRDAYRGGRVEAFRLWDCGPAELWDINSSYPFSFLDAPETDRLIYADVEVRGDGPGPLFALDGGEKLTFPEGRFRSAFWASSYERYIRPHRAIRALHIVRDVPCDFRWIRDLGETLRGAYQMRSLVKKTDPALAYALKIGLNSIYGRLGMKDEREIPITSEVLPESDDITFYRLSRGYLSFKKIRSKPAANYLFASFVTCNARARLYDALMRTGEPFYCDTDSVYLREGSGFNVTATGDEIGAWKPEGVAPLYVISAKDYLWGTKTVRKGGDESYLWTMKQMLKGKTVRQVRKRRISEYDKREVMPDGTTRPVFRSEW